MITICLILFIQTLLFSSGWNSKLAIPARTLFFTPRTVPLPLLISSPSPTARPRRPTNLRVRFSSTGSAGLDEDVFRFPLTWKCIWFQFWWLWLSLEWFECSLVASGERQRPRGHVSALEIRDKSDLWMMMMMLKVMMASLVRQTKSSSFDNGCPNRQCPRGEYHIIQIHWLGLISDYSCS